MRGNKYEGKQAEWVKTYLAPAVGCKITEVGVHAGFPYMMLEKDDGTKFRVEVSSDEEGNAAGFLFGLPPVTTNS